MVAKSAKKSPPYLSFERFIFVFIIIVIVILGGLISATNNGCIKKLKEKSNQNKWSGHSFKDFIPLELLILDAWKDVQASSRPLDDEFEVRLGSLSEVPAQEGESHFNVLTRFLRRPQCADPLTYNALKTGPSGSLSTTCSYDVFCFGKFLQELITGKLGISKSDDATSRGWLEHTLGYISTYDKELVTKIVDPSLIIDEEVWAMAIVARSCLNPKPSKRPSTKYIVKALTNPLKVVR